MNQYREMRERQQKEFNDFTKGNMFFAFSREQFAEGMKRLNLDPETDTDKIYRVPGGGYVLKAKAAEMHAILDRGDDEIKAACAADLSGDGFIFEMFKDILADHEYSYTGNLAESIDASVYTAEEINASPALLHGLEKAARYLLRGEE